MMPPTDLAQFDAAVQAFFDAHARPATARQGWGDGSDAVVASGLSKETHDEADIVAARKFQATLFDAGLGWLTGPPELGGSGLSGEHVRAFRSVERQYETPDLSVFMIGQRIVAPAIAMYGSAEHRAKYLRQIWRGEVIACQLFSEPDAGSDLASLRCRATRDGDGWRISGQKVWSSGAHISELGELLARTDPDPGSRNRGLSMFLVDMQSPGITIKPLQQMNGNAHFNEVFFEDVFVPEDALLGELGQGWAVANASLTSERDLDRDDAGLFVDPVGRVFELARHQDSTADPIVRQRLAEVYTRDRVSLWLAESAVDSPVAASLTKLFDAQSIWDLAQLAADLAGPGSVADDGSWGMYCWSDLVLGVHSQRIAGGTDEIQRNIIGERGLGLPREPRP